ncbi:MAG TPA: hypothetical protein VMU62_10840, partial [Acidobacteriaceae bacterium]|nr:hypothetical protein [Acidobacteriaceae bacterium]
MPTCVRSHAKINLGLAIGPTQPDGYHALTTIYQTLNLYDTVTVTAERMANGMASTIQLTCNDARVPCNARNTCWKMIELALEEMKIPARVIIHIDKKLPVQGGLGAGSANAVAALIGLERELGEALTGATQLAIAAKVGSDVPLFLIGGTVLGVGHGEIVSPLSDLPEIPCVIATPPIGVSTPQAFRDWDALQLQQNSDRTLTSLAASDRLKELASRWTVALAASHQEVKTASGVFPVKDRAEEPLL